MIGLRYKIHSVNVEKVAARAKIGERDVDAQLPGLVVELVGDDAHGHGNAHGHTFRILPATDKEFEEAKAAFVVGRGVTINVIPDKE